MLEPQFYIFGAVYMFSRIAMNCTAVFIPLYVALIMAEPGIDPEETTDTHFLVAVVPLIAYISSLGWSLLG